VTAFVHRTVLGREAVSLLAAGPGKIILDGTLGGGGHALALLDAGARVVGIDQDEAALTAARQRLQGRDVVISHGNFRDARAVLDALRIAEVDGALVDLGVSSPQLDDPSRGFSFREGGPLDMRMDPSRGRPLSERLDEWDEKALERILDSLGEERFARRIAREIGRAHAAHAIGRDGSPDAAQGPVGRMVRHRIDREDGSHRQPGARARRARRLDARHWPQGALPGVQRASDGFLHRQRGLRSAGEGGLLQAEGRKRDSRHRR